MRVNEHHFGETMMKNEGRNCVSKQSHQASSEMSRSILGVGRYHAGPVGYLY